MLVSQSIVTVLKITQVAHNFEAALNQHNVSTVNQH